MSDKQQVITYNFKEFIENLIALSKDGYVLCADSPHYPETYLGRHSAWMEKTESPNAPARQIAKLPVGFDFSEATRQLNELVTTAKEQLHPAELEELCEAFVNAFDTPHIHNPETRPEEAPDGFGDPASDSFIPVDLANGADAGGVITVEKGEVTQVVKYRAGPGRGHKKKK